MTRNDKLIIGITGNSGSGKTTVAKMLAAMGGYTIDADTVTHRVMEPDQSAYKKIVAAFGPDILGCAGKIDRKKLGAVVFADKKKRTQLESIVHPLVIDEILGEIANVNDAFITVDAVLLVESGLHRHCNAVWLITASEKDRQNRIIARDDLSLDAAQARMNNQRDTKSIAAISQTVICNDGTLSALEAVVSESLAALREAVGHHDFEVKK